MCVERVEVYKISDCAPPDNNSTGLTIDRNTQTRVAGIEQQAIGERRQRIPLFYSRDFSTLRELRPRHSQLLHKRQQPGSKHRAGELVGRDHRQLPDDKPLHVQRGRRVLPATKQQHDSGRHPIYSLLLKRT